MTVDEIKQLAATADREAVEQMLADEQAGENRVSAIAALQARLADLDAAPLQVATYQLEPDTTYVVNHPTSGEITIITGSDGRYSTDDPAELWALGPQALAAKREE
jgi:hypothetical protein